MELSDDITVVKGVGGELAKKLQILGIKTVDDLISYFPRRYDDYSEVATIRDIKPGMVTVKGLVKQSTGRYVRRGMHITEAIVSDDTGSVRAVWFNQPYRANALKPGVEYYFSGQYELSRQRFQLMNPSVEALSDFPVNAARITPIYRETKGLNSKQIRKSVANCRTLIKRLPETLPAWIIAEQKLKSRAEAVMAMHFPDSTAQMGEAKRRLGFEEVFELSLASLLNKRELAEDTSIAIPFDENLAKKFVENLPFTLTDPQRKAVWRIYLDMQSTHPMNRLVEGDVGSGKTVVATMAAIMALKGGYQVAFMAPTELLARQHADTIYKLLKPLGRENELALLVGALDTKKKQTTHSAIASETARFLVGTHALIQDKVKMPSLGLVIIDEQHRFGVEQRKGLMSKAGHMPHLLSLTATPIPRSLALTLYGELDISVLDAKPPGRQPIDTEIVSPNSVKPIFERVRAELDTGRQMFVVCPLISDSEALEAKSAEKTYEQFKRSEFKGYRIGLLHGKMSSEDKNTIMQQFVDHTLDILVSTTVIEVGVDVSNASIMMIQSAERFGLAQLHQLRGRVGRGSHKSYCFLMLDDSNAPSRRLRALESSENGFRLAELDLELRGPGAIYGQTQHGSLDLRVASLTDTLLIAAARRSAEEFLDRDENLLNYTELESRIRRIRTVTNLN